MSPGEYLVLALALLVGSGLQGSIGFGAGLVAAPVIALVRPDLLPSLVVCSALVITSVVTIRERSELDLRGAGWALAGRIPGSAIGAWMVVAISTTALSWVVALSVLLGIGSAFLGWRPAPSRPLLIGAGALSGIMGTSTSIGGAPMAIVWQGQEPARLRGTMSAFFLVGSAASLLLLASAGAVSTGSLAAFASLVPFVLAGVALSRLFNRLLDAARLRVLGLAVSAGGAVLLAVRLLAGA
ncbi:MAG TPA: sulfite exporter TauE/SafE family protein [Arthrobacter sp.]|nr:sulfite exporter TauE/SafE family protein [Arthrobacter sp.]